MTKPLTLAVVGHTNVGKTSLLRTLTRDVGFGEVSHRPSTTRHVEGARLSVDGQALLELYDTPGLEDAIALLEQGKPRDAAQQLEAQAALVRGAGKSPLLADAAFAWHEAGDSARARMLMAQVQPRQLSSATRQRFIESIDDLRAADYITGTCRQSDGLRVRFNQWIYQPQIG